MKKYIFASGLLVIGSFALIAAALSSRPSGVIRRPSVFGPAPIRTAGLEKHANAAGEQISEAFPSHRLSSCEEAIAIHPFASKAARQQMRRILDKEGESEKDVPEDRGDMGWAQPDRQYWQHIPAAARRIPNNLSDLPVVRFTNTEIDGERRIWLQEGQDWDQWVLQDAEHDVWACISVERSTKRVYFREMAPLRKGGWRLRPGQDNCFSCHPSGPRVIRPFATKTLNLATLNIFNRRILSYDACNFGDSVDLRLRGKPISDVHCVGCHNGIRRGQLYAINYRVVHFKTKREQTMPPGHFLF